MPPFPAGALSLAAPLPCACARSLPAEMAIPHWATATSITRPFLRARPALLDDLVRAGHRWTGLLGAWARSWTELRIDVDLSGRDIQREFDALNERIRNNHRTRDAMQALPLHLHGLVFRHREADGEVFVYAIDPLRNRIVACTVFNRLVEVNRHTDRHLRAPHSRVADGYRRMGIASAIYRWWLDSGRSLMTGARQSAGAHGLWMALARDYELAAVRIAEHKCVEQLPMPPPPGFYTALDTRLVLVGRGCRPGDFMRPAPGGGCAAPSLPGAPRP